MTKGLLAGAAGGLAGAWAMTRFSEGWAKLSGAPKTRLGTPEEEDATSKVVDILTRRVLHVRLRRPQKQRAETGIHYAVGVLLGAAYGVLAEVVPGATIGAGAPFGALEWLFGNKLTAPRMGIIKPRGHYSRQERVQTFASHVVFGITAELGRRTLRSELPDDWSVCG